MIKRTSQPLRAWFTCCDLLLALLAWLGAYYLRFESGLVPVFKDTPDFRLCVHDLPLVALFSLVAFRLAGQYEIHRLRRFREEMLAVLKGGSLLALMVMSITFFRHDPYESRLTMLLFWALTCWSILVMRRLTWSAVRKLRQRGFNNSHTLVVGTGRVARKTARALRCASWMGLKNVGFVEDQPSRFVSDLKILGTIDDLPEIVEKNNVEHVFIALPMRRFADARRVFDVLSQSLVEVRYVADVPDLAGLSLTTSNLDGLPVIGLRESPHFGLNVIVKRVMDFVLSLLALIMLSPVMAVLAVIVKLSSPGPMFYRQERCGLNGKPFWMLKFRTMPVDAEAGTGPVWACKDDPRRTKLGSFLRKTSLDELPQFINVLKGDMSLVGPRPERPVFIQKFRKTVPNYMARHCVKAGITGWAQVHGWRGNTSLRKRVLFDLYYITHWNPWLDIRILCMTLWTGVFHRNAY
ncbi:MAG TPA: undecaprenyl-phosphate glucose phosphotransferase [Gemmataceae bacterium]|nr:undecaprenyl-phosphate glucose phosphotransferase [Gemmataceae bacterium]